MVVMGSELLARPTVPPQHGVTLVTRWKTVMAPEKAGVAVAKIMKRRK